MSKQPVLVGVGRCADDAEPLELIERAIRAASADSGATGLLRSVGRIAMPRGTWTYRNPGAVVASRLGLGAVQHVVADVGVPQQTLVSDALSVIARGEFDAVVVVGAEARAWSAGVVRRGETATETPALSEPDMVLSPATSLVTAAEIAARFWEPVEQYAVIESALLHAEGGSLDEIDQLWSRFAAIASTCPHAAFRDAPTAEQLRSDSDGNRLLAWPYRKRHSTQWTVNQAAALLMCSTDVAREHGVPPDRLVYPRVALESSLTVPLPARRALHRWPAMKVLGDAASAAIGRPLAEIEAIELYSCFPSAVRIQQRELGLPIGGTPTITGGMAFAGGPFNNFTYQATVAMVERLREQPASLGMVTTVSGLLTKPGLMIWSATPGPLHIADVAAAADAATEICEVEVEYHGPARVAAATITGQGDGIVVAETPVGQRIVARSPNVTTPVAEIIGSEIHVQGATWIR